MIARGAPGSAGARRALEVCSEISERGGQVTLALIGDATQLARAAELSGVDLLCLAEDARMRGVDPDYLPHVRWIDRHELVDELFAAGRVVGAL